MEISRKQNHISIFMIFMVFVVLFGKKTAKCRYMTNFDMITNATQMNDLLLNLSADLKYQMYPSHKVTAIQFVKQKRGLRVVWRWCKILYPTSTSCGPSGERALKTIQSGMFLVTQTALHFGLKNSRVGVTHKLVS